MGMECLGTAISTDRSAVNLTICIYINREFDYYRYDLKISNCQLLIASKLNEDRGSKCIAKKYDLIDRLTVTIKCTHLEVYRIDDLDF